MVFGFYTLIFSYLLRYTLFLGRGFPIWFFLENLDHLLGIILLFLGRFLSGRASPPLRHTLGTRVYPYRILRHHGTEMDRCIKDDGLLHGYGGHEVIHGTILLLMIISAH